MLRGGIVRAASAALLSCACSCAPVTQETIARDRLQACEATVPAEVRERVGITGERLERGGAVDTGSRVVSLQIEDRTPALAACAPRGRGLFATFLVDAWGKVTEPVVAALPENPQAEACAAREIASWHVPGAGSGGLFFAAIRLGAGTSGPAGAYRGWSAARPRSCAFEGGVPVLVHEGAVGGLDVVVHLLVHFDGSKSFVHTSRPLPPEVFAALERGVRACDFDPAWDDASIPRDTWVSLPVRVRPY